MNLLIVHLSRILAHYRSGGFIMVYTRIPSLTGSKLHATPYRRLQQLYFFINRYLVKFPEECVYKKNTKTLIDYRNSILEVTSDLEDIECMMNCGSFEQLIKQAENELLLAKVLLPYKPWEPLISTPPENQWTWPLKPT